MDQDRIEVHTEMIYPGQAALLGLLSNSTAIVYRPELAKALKDRGRNFVNAAIFLQQVCWWWERQEHTPFYKFNEPCDHQFYRPGDSWSEELGFSRYMVEAARDMVGVKKTRDMTVPQAIEKAQEAGKPIIYWTNTGHVTYYTVHVPTLCGLLEQVFATHPLVTHIKKANAEKSHRQCGKVALANAEKSHQNNREYQRPHRDLSASAEKKAQPPAVQENDVDWDSIPEEVEITLDDTTRVGLGRSARHSYECECGVSILFDSVGDRVTCSSCGMVYSLARRQRTPDDPVFKSLVAIAMENGQRFRPNQMEKKDWRAAIRVAGADAAREWIAFYEKRGMKGNALAYAVLKSVIKHQEAPTDYSKRDDAWDTVETQIKSEIRRVGYVGRPNLPDRVMTAIKDAGLTWGDVCRSTFWPTTAKAIREAYG